MWTRRRILAAGGGGLATLAAPGLVRAAGMEVIAMSGTSRGEHVWFRPQGLAVSLGTTLGFVNRDPGNSPMTTTYHPDPFGRPRRMPVGTVAAMAEARLTVSPTLVVADFYLGARPGSDALRMRVLPPEVRAAWEQPEFRLEAMTEEIRAIADRSIALDRRTFLVAHQAGVPILASTDASYANPFIFHGFSLLDEINRYVLIGLTPQEALFTATVAPPVFLRLPDQDGTLAPGRWADIVLLTDNPLEGLTTPRQPVAVIAKGRLMDRGDLDAATETLLAQGR